MTERRKLSLWPNLFSQVHAVRLARVVCGVVLSCLVLPAAAQAQAGVLRGQVVDPQGLAIADANARLYADSASQVGRPLQRTLTDMQGQFDFQELAPGRYRLEVFAAGFQRQEQLVELGKETRQVEIRLLLAGVHQGVVVTATRQEGETFDTPLPAALVPVQSLD